MRFFGRVRRVGLGRLLTALSLAGAVSQAAPDPRRDVVVEVVERVLPCVVNIATEQIVEYRDPFAELFREFWGPHYRQRPRATRYSLGSGVIIDAEGYILTNMHVVQRATRVWVQLADGRELEARPGIVGTARTDVALLKLVTDKPERFPSLPLAKDDDLLLGETVLALGNPFGLGGSVSRGILSSKNRRPPLDREVLEIADWLQTDAAINPGSSGGPLVNLRGELIGLNVAIYREGEGIGFAIPVKQVAQALSEIFVPEVHFDRWFGAQLRCGPYPLRVLRVDAGSPAARAGLEVDDEIVSLNGVAPAGFFDGIRALGEAAEPEIRVKLRRGERAETVEVRLGTLAELVRHRLGVSVQELTPDLADQFGYGSAVGLLIADVAAGGPAAEADLQPGHLIISLDGQATPDLRRAAAALAGQSSGSAMDLGVMAWQRRGNFRPRLIRATVSVRLR